jgi:hypothetical protein
MAVADSGISTIENTVDLWRISTPGDLCLKAHFGAIDPLVVAEAIENHFDYLPVITPKGRPVGAVAVAHLQSLIDTGTTLEQADRAIVSTKIGPFPSVLSLLAALSSSRAVIVREPKHSDPNDDASSDFAFLTISDLNKHPFRAVLYPILLELEASLAELIDRLLPDPWKWIPTLSDRSQISIVGEWELEKRHGVETYPITSCTLADMFTVLGNVEELHRLLGFSSKSECKKLCGSIPGLRNRVMHPVRPLILTPHDVKTLHQDIERVSHLNIKLDALNAGLRPGRFSSWRVRP